MDYDSKLRGAYFWFENWDKPWWPGSILNVISAKDSFVVSLLDDSAAFNIMSRFDRAGFD